MFNVNFWKRIIANQKVFNKPINLITRKNFCSGAQMSESKMTFRKFLSEGYIDSDGVYRSPLVFIGAGTGSCAGTIMLPMKLYKEPDSHNYGLVDLFFASIFGGVIGAYAGYALGLYWPITIPALTITTGLGAHDKYKKWKTGKL